jgi:hypothetical protein
MSFGKVKGVLKGLLPKGVYSLITGSFFGWHGNYSSWEEAKKIIWP